MEAVVGLLLVLMGVSHAVETSCDGRQDGARCVGALGGAVNIQLVDDASELHVFDWKKGGSFIIVKWRNKTNIVKSEGNKSIFIPSNGTVRINNLNRADSGEYELEIFYSSGRQTGHRTLQLSLQALVSSVQLVSECGFLGQIVSCSSEGDSPQYSWTLDGHTLTDSELLSGNDQTNVIVLRQNISGRLVCSVRNQVSQSSRQEDISTCGASSSLICGIRFLLVVLLLIGIFLYFTWRKKKSEKVNPPVVSEDQNDYVMMYKVSSASESNKCLNE